jgi:hypothetical protein
MACRGLYFVFDVLPQTSGDELYTSGTHNCHAPTLGIAFRPHKETYHCVSGSLLLCISII